MFKGVIPQRHTVPEEFLVGDRVTYFPHISTEYKGTVIDKDNSHYYVRWDHGTESAIKYRNFPPTLKRESE